MSTMMLLLVGFMGFVAIGGVGLLIAGVGGDGSSAKTARRMQTFAARNKPDKARARVVDTAGVRRKQILEHLKAVDKQERKAKLTLASRLRQAGLSMSPRTFWIASGGLGVGVMLMAFILRASPLIALGLGFAAGLGLPRWVLGFLIKRRTKKFTEEFPNATDVIVRGIKSGLPVNDCLKVIGRESPEPLAGEFRRLVESTAVGMAVDQALDKMHENMPTSEVRFFGIVLSIQQKTGGNLAEALNNLSLVLRARKLMREKIKAMAGEAVASAFIIGSLPPGVMLMIYLSTPAYMMPLFTDPRGHAMLLFAGIWMSTGIFIMRRMINFKF